MVDVSRLDFRIGLIKTAKRHPEADTLYVEESEARLCGIASLIPSPLFLSVDIGEETPRTVCSGLVKHIPLDEIQVSECVLVSTRIDSLFPHRIAT